MAFTFSRRLCVYLVVFICKTEKLIMAFDWRFRLICTHTKLFCVRSLHLVTKKHNIV